MPSRILLHFSGPQDSKERLAVLDPHQQKVVDIASPYALFGSLSVATVGNHLTVATTGGSPTRPSEAAALVVANIEELLAAKVEQWVALRKSSTTEAWSHFIGHHPTSRPSRTYAI